MATKRESSALFGLIATIVILAGCAGPATIKHHAGPVHVDLLKRTTVNYKVNGKGEFYFLYVPFNGTHRVGYHVHACCKATSRVTVLVLDQANLDLLLARKPYAWDTNASSVNVSYQSKDFEANATVILALTGEIIQRVPDNDVISYWAYTKQEGAQ